MTWLTLSLLGIFAGLSSVFLGIGGGVFIVPILTIYLELPVHQAVATSLLTIFLITSSNTYLFHRDGLINWQVAFNIGPAAALFSFISGLLAQEIPGSIIKKILIGLYIFLTIILIVRYFRSTDGEVRDRKSIKPFKKVIASGVVGTVAGIFSGLTGIGAGVIVGPVVLGFQLVKPLNYTPTINAVMSMATFSGAMSYMNGPWNGFQLGQVQFHYAVVLFFLAFLISLLTRRHQSRLSENLRIWVLVGLLVFLISKLLFI